MQREKCPCCGYPTLSERGIYDICELCNWEDDGQDDPYADEVWGGPNKDYSLTEARKNFKENLMMYRDRRNLFFNEHSNEEIQTKKSLMYAFGNLDKCKPNTLEYKSIWSEIKSYEDILDIILHEIVERYDNNIKKNEAACKLINTDENETENVIQGLLELAINADDPDFVQYIMVQYSENDNENIRGIAILCFGHIAKIHGKIDKELVLSIVNRGLKDDSSYVRGHSQSALDDINNHMK